MGSQKSKSKASKGTVQIKISNQRLQLVFSFGGKRHYLSTGFTDTKANRKLAEMKAKQIELDILCNNFDITLERYKPEAQQAIFTPSAHNEKSPVIYASLADLWDSYTEYKRSSLSPSTLAKDYKKIYRCINVHLPVKTLDKAVAIRDWLIANRSPLSAKKILTQFSACCNWAVKSQLIEDNPFADMASDIKVRHGDSEETDINPFNVEERDRIIKAFKENRYYAHYAPLIEFLFITGCR
ncbi:MAG: Arm DNA-binding domain-containing protein, partial [Rivularia sp. (in: cyanobacteria)]